MLLYFLNGVAHRHKWYTHMHWMRYGGDDWVFINIFLCFVSRIYLWFQTHTNTRSKYTLRNCVYLSAYCSGIHTLHTNTQCVRFCFCRCWDIKVVMRCESLFLSLQQQNALYFDSIFCFFFFRHTCALKCHSISSVVSLFFKENRFVPRLFVVVYCLQTKMEKNISVWWKHTPKKIFFFLSFVSKSKKTRYRCLIYFINTYLNELFVHTKFMNIDFFNPKIEHNSTIFSSIVYYFFELKHTKKWFDERIPYSITE